MADPQNQHYTEQGIEPPSLAAQNCSYITGRALWAKNPLAGLYWKDKVATACECWVDEDTSLRVRLFCRHAHGFLYFPDMGNLVTYHHVQVLQKMAP